MTLEQQDEWYEFRKNSAKKKAKNKKARKE
jgi:hypothetical protein